MAKNDIELTIGIQHPSGLKEVQRSFKGSLKDIQKELDGLNVGEFHKGMKISAREINQVRHMFKAAKHEIEAAGKGVLRLKRANKQYRSEINNLGHIQYYQMIQRGDKMVRKNIRTEIAERQNLIKSMRNIDHSYSRTKKTVSHLRQELDKTFGKRKQALMNSYKQQIAKIQTQISTTGTTSAGLDKKLTILQNNLAKIERTDLSAVISQFDDISETNFSDLQDEISSTFSHLKGEMDGIIASNPATKIKAGITNAASGFNHQFAGAFGFGFLEVGNRIQEIIEGMRVENAFSGFGKKIGNSLSSVLGSTMGSIAGDLLSAVGRTFELITNLVTKKIRMIGILIGIAFKSLGFIIASGTVATVSVGLGPAAAGVAILFGALGLTAMVKAFITEVTGMLKQMMDAIASIFSAGLKALGAIVKAGLTVVSSLIKAAFTGIKETLTAIADAFVQTTKKVIATTTKLVSDGLNKFIELQTGAVRAAKEIADKGNQVGRVIREINQTRINFGFDRKDTAAAYFDIVSSGLRDAREQQVFMNEAAKLAIADQSTIANSTNALITVYHNYGKKLSDVRRISNLLSTSTTLGRTSLEELGPALKNVVGISKFAGLSLEDLLASITSMTRIFGRGSTKSITRFLSRFVEAVSNPTSRARKEFEELGVSVNSLGDGNFNDKFIKLLRQLEGIQPDQLRTFFPTIQSRKAFTALVADVDRYVKVLNEVRSLQGLQGMQLRLIGKQLTQRLKQVKQIVDIGKESLGRIAATLMRITIFSDKSMRAWFRIGHLLNNVSAPAALTFARYIKATAAPLIDRILPAMYDLSRSISRIASVNPFRSPGWRDIGMTLRESLTLVTELYDRLKSGVQGANVIDRLRNSLLVLLKRFNVAFRNALENGIDVTSLFDKFKDGAKTLGGLIRDAVTIGLNSAAESMLDLNAMMLQKRVDGVDIKANMSPENAELLTAMQNAAKAFAVLLKNAFVIAFEAIGDLLGKALKDSTNVFVNEIRNSLMGMLKILSFFETTMREYAIPTLDRHAYESAFKELNLERLISGTKGSGEVIKEKFGHRSKFLEMLQSETMYRGRRGAVIEKLKQDDSPAARRLIKIIERGFAEFDRLIQHETDTLTKLDKLEIITRRGLLGTSAHEREAMGKGVFGRMVEKLENPGQRDKYWEQLTADLAKRTAEEFDAAQQSKEAAKRTKQAADALLGKGHSNTTKVFDPTNAVNNTAENIEKLNNTAKALIGEISDLNSRNQQQKNAINSHGSSFRQKLDDLRARRNSVMFDLGDKFKKAKANPDAVQGAGQQAKIRAEAKKKAREFSKARVNLLHKQLIHPVLDSLKHIDNVHAGSPKGLAAMRERVDKLIQALLEAGLSRAQANFHVDHALKVRGGSAKQRQFLLDKKPNKKFNKGTPRVPGTGNADTIPALLTPGEAVIPRSAVSHYGAPFIQSLIHQDVPKMAWGGIIGDIMPDHKSGSRGDRIDRHARRSEHNRKVRAFNDSIFNRNHKRNQVAPRRQQDPSELNQRIARYNSRRNIQASPHYMTGVLKPEQVLDQRSRAINAFNNRVKSQAGMFRLHKEELNASFANKRSKGPPPPPLIKRGEFKADPEEEQRMRMQEMIKLQEYILRETRLNRMANEHSRTTNDNMLAVLNRNEINGGVDAIGIASVLKQNNEIALSVLNSGNNAS